MDATEKFIDDVIKMRELQKRYISLPPGLEKMGVLKQAKAAEKSVDWHIKNILSKQEKPPF